MYRFLFSCKTHIQCKAQILSVYSLSFGKHMHLCHQIPVKIQKLHNLRKYPQLPYQSPPSSYPPGQLLSFFFSFLFFKPLIRFTFPDLELDRYGVIHYILFCVKFLSLSLLSIHHMYQKLIPFHCSAMFHC